MDKNDGRDTEKPTSADSEPPTHHDVTVDADSNADSKPHGEPDAVGDPTADSADLVSSPGYADTDFDPNEVATEFSAEAGVGVGVALQPSVSRPLDKSIEKIQARRNRARELRNAARTDTERVLRASTELRELLTYPISDERLVPELERRLFAAQAIRICLDQDPLQFVPASLTDRDEQVDAEALAEDLCDVLETECGRGEFAAAEYTVGKPQIQEQTTGTLILTLAELGAEIESVAKGRFDLLSDCLKSTDTQVQKAATIAVRILAESDATVPDSAIEDLRQLLVQEGPELQPSALSAIYGIAEQDSELALGAVQEVRETLSNNPSDTVAVEALRVLRRLSEDHAEALLDTVSLLNDELIQSSPRRAEALLTIWNLIREDFETVSPAVSTSRIRDIVFERGRSEEVPAALLVLIGFASRKDLRFSDEETATLFEYLTHDSESIKRGTRRLLGIVAADNPYVRNRVAALLDEGEEESRIQGLGILSMLAINQPNDILPLVDIARLRKFISTDSEEVDSQAFALLAKLAYSNPDIVSDELLEDVSHYLVKEDSLPESIFDLLSVVATNQPERLAASDINDMLPDLLRNGSEVTETGVLKVAASMVQAAPKRVGTPVEVEALYEYLSADNENLRDTAARLLGYHSLHDDSIRETLIDNVEEYPKIDAVFTYAILQDEDAIDDITAFLDDNDPSVRAVALETVTNLSRSSDSSVSIATLDCLDELVDLLRDPDDNVVEAAVTALVSAVHAAPQQLSQTGVVSTIVNRLDTDTRDQAKRSAVRTLQAIASMDETDVTETKGFKALPRQANPEEYPGGFAALVACVAADDNSRAFARDLLRDGEEGMAMVSAYVFAEIAQDRPELLADTDLLRFFAETVAEQSGETAEISAQTLLFLTRHDVEVAVDADVHRPVLEHILEAATPVQRRFLRVLFAIAESDPDLLFEVDIERYFSTLLAQDEVLRGVLLLFAWLASRAPDRLLREEYLSKTTEIIERSERELGAESADEEKIRAASALIVGLYARRDPELVLEYIPVDTMVDVALLAQRDEEDIVSIAAALSEIVEHNPSAVYEAGVFDDVLQFLQGCDPDSIADGQLILNELLVADPERAETAFRHIANGAGVTINGVPDAGPLFDGSSSPEAVVAETLERLEEVDVVSQRLAAVSLAYAAHHEIGTLNPLGPALTGADGEVQVGLLVAVTFLVDSHPAVVKSHLSRFIQLVSSPEERVRGLTLDVFNVLVADESAAIRESEAHRAVAEALVTERSPAVREVALQFLEAFVAEYPEAFDGFELTADLINVLEDSEADGNDESEARELIASIIVSVAAEDDFALDPLCDDLFGEGDVRLQADVLHRVVRREPSVLGYLTSRLSTVEAQSRSRLILALALAMVAEESPRLVADADVVSALRDQLAAANQGASSDVASGADGDGDTALDREVRTATLHCLARVGRFEPTLLADSELVAALTACIDPEVGEARVAAFTLQLIADHHPSLFTDVADIDEIVERGAALEGESAGAVCAALGSLVAADQRVRRHIIESVVRMDDPQREFLAGAIGYAHVETPAVIHHLSDHLADVDCSDETRQEILVTALERGTEEDAEVIAGRSTVSLATTALDNSRITVRASAASMLRRIAKVSSELVANEVTVSQVVPLLTSEHDEVQRSIIDVVTVISHEEPQLVAEELSMAHLEAILESAHENPGDAAGSLLLATLPYSTEIQQQMPEWVQSVASEAKDEDSEADFTAEAESEPEAIAESRDAHAAVEPADGEVASTPEATPGTGGDVEQAEPLGQVSDVADVDDNDSDDDGPREDDVDNASSTGQHDDTDGEGDDLSAIRAPVAADLVEGVASILDSNKGVGENLYAAIHSEDHVVRTGAEVLLKAVLDRQPKAVDSWVRVEELCEWLEGDRFERELGLALAVGLTDVNSQKVADGRVIDQALELLGSEGNSVRARELVTSLAVSYEHVRRAVASFLASGTPDQQTQASAVFYALLDSEAVRVDLRSMGVLDAAFDIFTGDTEREFNVADNLVARAALTDERVQRRVVQAFTAENEALVYHACGISGLLVDEEPALAFELGLHEELLSVLESDSVGTDVREMAVSTLRHYVSERPETFRDRGTLETLATAIDDDSAEVVVPALKALARIALDGPDAVREAVALDDIKAELTIQESEAGPGDRQFAALLLLNKLREAADRPSLRGDTLDRVLGLLGAEPETVRRAAATVVKKVAVDYPESFAAAGGFDRLDDMLVDETMESNIAGGVYIFAAKESTYCLNQVLSLAVSEDEKLQSHGFGILSEVTIDTDLPVEGPELLVDLMAGFDHERESTHRFTDAVLRRTLGERPELGLNETFVRALEERARSDGGIEQEFVMDTLLLLQRADPEFVQSTVELSAVLPLFGADDEEGSVPRSALLFVEKVLAADPPDVEFVVSLFDRPDVPVILAGFLIARAARQNTNILSVPTALFEVDDADRETDLTKHALGILQLVAKTHPDAVAEEFGLERALEYIDLDEDDSRGFAVLLASALLQREPTRCETVLEAYEADEDRRGEAVKNLLKDASMNSQAVRDEVVSVLDGGAPHHVHLSLDVLRLVEVSDANPALPDVGDQGPDGDGEALTVDENSIEHVVNLLVHEDEEVRDAAESYLSVLVRERGEIFDLTFALPVAEEIFRTDGNEAYAAAAAIAQSLSDHHPERALEGGFFEFLVDHYGKLDVTAESYAMWCLYKLVDAAPAEALDGDLVDTSFDLLHYDSERALYAWFAINSRVLNADLTVYTDPALLEALVEILVEDHFYAAAHAYQTLLTLASDEPDALFAADVVETLATYLTAEERVLRWRVANVFDPIALERPGLLLETAGDEVISILDEIVVEYQESSPEERQLDAEDVEVTAYEYPGIVGLPDLLSACSTVPPLSVETYLSLVTHETDHVQLGAARLLKEIARVDPDQLRPHRSELRRVIRSDVSASRVHTHLFETLRRIGSETVIRDFEELSDPVHEF